MMNELLKIQNDMAAPQQHQQQRQNASGDEGDSGAWLDPNDWIADLPNFGFYHRGYTTNHWLQIFRAL